MKTLTAGLASLLLAAGASVYAQEAEESSEPEKALETERKHKKQMHKHRMKHKGQKMVERMMAGADSNEDAKVDLNEYLTFAESRFNQMDMNSDGYITAEEMRGWSKEMRKKHHEAMKEARQDYREATKDEREAFRKARRDAYKAESATPEEGS